MSAPDPSPRRVLFVSGDRAWFDRRRQEIDAALEDEIEVACTNGELGALRSLADASYDACVIHSVPGISDGFRIARHAIEQGIRTPLVVVADRRAGTAEDGQPVVVLIAGGATGGSPIATAVARAFEVSSPVASRLDASTPDAEEFTRLCTEVREERARREALERASLRDELTGLPNRRALEVEIQRLIEASRRAPSLDCVALVVADIDRLKFFNDSLGLAAGDQLLAEAGRRFADAVRPGDFAARSGGDEFALLLKTCADPSEAEALARRVCERLCAPYAIDGARVHVTASLGVALLDDRCADAADFLRRADAALERAKAEGGSRAEVFSTAMRRQSDRRDSLLLDLPDALRAGRLSLVMSPIVDADRGRPVAFSTRPAWMHPRLGFVDTDDTIAVAERAGMLADCYRWLVAESCRRLRRLWLSMDESPALSIAIPETAVAQRDVVDVIQAEAIRAGVELDLLWLELDEQLLARFSEWARTTLGELHRRGVHLCLDDFGAEYASLSFLRRYPIDILRLDRAMIHGVTEDADKRDLIATLITLAHHLHMRVVARGVRTVLQSEALVAAGCDYIEGDAAWQLLDRGTRTLIGHVARPAVPDD